MFRIGLVVENETKAETLYKIIYNYTHIPAHRHMRGSSEWHLPLLDLDILCACQIRGRRYDLIFYDEKIDSVIIDELFYPCCMNRPKPLKNLLMRMNINEQI